MSIKESLRNVVVIGYGEVGRAFGGHIEKSNVVLTRVDPLVEGVHDGRQVLGSFPETIPDGSLVLGTIPSAASFDVARQLATIDGEFLYLDLSSSSQGLMHECAALFEGRPVEFVDGAIMGSVDLAGAGAPILLSGPAAQRGAVLLSSLGFQASALSDSAAGDACGLKLLRTLMTKGIEALAIECFVTADRMKLGKELRENLLDVCARPFPDLLDAMVRTHVVHAPRRLHEVEAAIHQAESVGVMPPVTAAVLEVYRNTARRVASERPSPPKDVRKALDWLSAGLQ